MSEERYERDGEQWGPEHLRVREARSEARRLARALRHQIRGASFTLGIGVGPSDPGKEHEEREERSERTFTVRGMPTLRVSNVSGDTRIGVGEAGTVTVRARKYVRGASADHAKRLLESFEIQMEQDGDTIVVTPTLNGQTWRDLFRGRRVAVDLDITVPRETALDARSTSGDLHVTGLRGHLSLHNVSGDTVLVDLQGPLRLRTVSGDLRAKSFAGQCECNSVSGDLGFEGSRLREADLQTVSGDISLDGALEASRQGHRIRSVSGDVSLGLTGSSFQVDYRTLSGDFDCRREARVAREGRRDRLVLVGAGEVRVKVKTVSGDLCVAASGASVPDPAVADPADPAKPAEPADPAKRADPAGTADPADPQDAAAGGSDTNGARPSATAGQGATEDPAMAGATQGASQRGRIVRVRITEGGSQKVNIAIPLAIARVGKVKLGGLVRGHLAKFGIDLDEVLRQAEETGRIVDIADGPDRVEIFVD